MKSLNLRQIIKITTNQLAENIIENHLHTEPLTIIVFSCLKKRNAIREKNHLNVLFAIYFRMTRFLRVEFL